MLSISNLSFSYHDRDIFDQVSLTLQNSDRVALIGDNGTGKTTLLRLLNGELQPDVGSIRLDGKVGYLPQTHGAHPDKSGGERTRLALEQIFTQHPDILLLDEPTNNLDSTAQNWLITKLRTFPGLILLVSHDRYFIDQIAEQIVEISDHKLHLHRGNYSDFTARNQQLRSQKLQAYEKAQRAKRTLIKHITYAQNLNNKTDHLRFNKFRDENKQTFHFNRNDSQVSAGKIIKSSKTQLARLNQIEKPAERKTYQAKISADFLRHRRLLSVQDLSKSYGTKSLFHHLTFDIFTSDRIRIAGGNGTGKTTLFHIILDELPPDSGNVTLAPNLRLGYISQDISGLDLDQTFLAQSPAHSTDIFQAAATMDLTKSDLATPIKSLSRGQITKLSFLKIILNPVDLLILDEPTNHLDIRARENVETALADYAGAILFATHDEVFTAALHPDQTITLVNS